MQWFYPLNFHARKHLNLENRNSVHIVHIIHMNIKYNGLRFGTIVGAKQQLIVMNLELENIFLPIILEFVL